MSAVFVIVLVKVKQKETLLQLLLRANAAINVDQGDEATFTRSGNLAIIASLGIALGRSPSS
jgi:hypothetical protein